MSFKAQLFITCLHEQFFPGVLEKMVSILERLGGEVYFPEDQTCCGQAFFNSGFQTEARKVAQNWLRAFSESDASIISPSGSCVDMIRHHYLELFPEGTPEHAQVQAIAGRTFEFTEFIVNELKITDVGACFAHKVTYHPSCHQMRGLGVREEPKQLLRAVRGMELVPLPEEETCCGFGGIFSVVYPEVSRAMMENKIQNIMASGAEYVISCDAGCLMNMGGGLHKAGSPIKALHLIDILAEVAGTQGDGQ